MAFVSKQERDSGRLKSETRNIGPGEYYDNNDENIDKDLKNCYPFNNQADRVTFEIPYEHKIRNIGPGTYEANSSFIKKSFSTRSIEQFNPLDKSLFGIIERTKEMQGKDNIKMIQESLLIKKLQPKKVNQSQRVSKPRQHFRIYDTTNSSLRVVSIPLKNSYGYMFDENNNPIIVEDFNKGVSYSGDSYNMNLNQTQDDDRLKKKLRGIEWSKMSLKNSTTITNGNTAPFTQQSTSNIHNNNSYSNSSHIYVNEKSFNYLRSKILNKRRSVDPKVSMEDQIIEDVLAKPPGPGYYWNEDYNSFIKQPKNKSRPFGSMEVRQFKLTQRCKEDNPKVGPGSYYKTRYIPKKVNYYPFNANDNKMEDSACKDNPYLGPGSYNVRKDLQITKPSSIYLGALNKRFNYYIKPENINPGPGEYLDIEKWGRIPQSPVDNNAKVNKIVEHKEHITPGAGHYNQDIVHSIEYKNKSNENKLQSFIAPFKSGSERFILNNKSMSALLGPGCYFKEKIEKIKKKKLLPHVGSVNSLNHSLMSKDDGGLGPGLYNTNNYYDWNKRSYNTNFI